MTAISLTGVTYSANADKLCIKLNFNKKTSKVSAAKAVAAVCPKGFTELVDTSTFVGPQGPAGASGSNGAVGPQGPAGTNGANGNINLASCIYETATFTPCPEGDACASELVCGGAGATNGSETNDYMIHYMWGLSGNAAYVTNVNTLLVNNKYPTGIRVTSTSEETYGTHTPTVGIVCCLPN